MLFKILPVGLLLVAFLPLASAAVTVDEILVPDRTLAGKPFEVRVRIVNEGPAMTVDLFGALYVGEGVASSPCGPATDPRFRRFTQLVQEPVEIPANSVVEYPGTGDRWLHRYEASDVPATPTQAELCVFVAREASTPAIQYEAYAATPLPVRGANEPPAPALTWDPERPRATEDVRFQASATDAEDDPITFRWDFGHDNANGRAVAEGASATHFFYPAGEYVVTLYASDGLDELPASATVTVRASDAPPERDLLTPWPGALVLVTFVAVCLVGRQARIRGGAE